MESGHGGLETGRCTRLKRGGRENEGARDVGRKWRTFEVHYEGSGFNDGQWHAIRLVAKENFAMLMIDGDEASAVRSTSPLSINTGGTYHLGGKELKGKWQQVVK
ncbi:unnamed protein product [Pleuronectes platessa]|uniref:Laminin G domain-containing protein n=1 Tax=Pleuronectes platessa TaxID=8262 RepID=A0A9N7VIL8_PLEPL|nr:unnamed protein product [Pleuronectes platessa]